ncbi:MAG TPA: hypothetical protein PLA94_25380, partial [Myxococcota bacterium]|nr:hypothetical protein [Myxococcota bacterium]
QREQAQDAFRQAVDAYRRNDFEQAEVWLHQVEALSGEDDNANRLQSNIDLLLDNTISSSNSSKDDAQARRVREMANARSFDLRDQQVESEKKADEALKRGDYDTAERELENVTRSAQILQRMEQAGSEEQRAVYGSASSALAEVKKAKAKKEEEEAVVVSDPEPAQRIVVSETTLMIADDWDAPPSDPAGSPVFAVQEELRSEPMPVVDSVVPIEAGRLTADPAEAVTADEDMDGVFDGLLEGEISGLIGGMQGGVAGGTVSGLGGLGVRGTGMGGGGTAEGSIGSVGGQKERDDREPRGGGAKNEDKPSARYKDTTEIDFEGLDVSGGLVEPNAALIMDRKRAELPPLIQTRSSFAPEEPMASPDAPGPAPAPAPALSPPPPPATTVTAEYSRRAPASRSASGSTAAPAAEEAYGGEELDENQPTTGAYENGDDDLAEDAEEELHMVPGRTYQSVVQSAPGVARGRGAGPAAPKTAAAPRELEVDNTPPVDFAVPARSRSTGAAKKKPEDLPSNPVRGPAPAKGQPPGTAPVQRTVAFAQTPTPVTLALPLDTPAF